MNYECSKIFKDFNITATKQDIDGSIHVVQEDIIEETNQFSEKEGVVNEDENTTPYKDDPMNVDTTSQKLQSSNILDNVYATSVILEKELSSAEMQTVVGNNYGKLQSAFNNFQNILKKTWLHQKASPLTDTLSKASSSK